MEHHQPSKKRVRPITTFFQRLGAAETSTSQPSNASNEETAVPSIQPSPMNPQTHDFDSISIERDPGLRIPIWKQPVNQRDDIRRAYIKAGPYQPELHEYPRTQFGNQFRRFKYSWFQQFSWLEYSPSKDLAFCFPCFLFHGNTSNRVAFTVQGFKSWKRVNDGENCAFLKHVGEPTSPHNNALRGIQDLADSTRHINIVMNAQSSEEIQKNRLRLKATIESVRWLAFQACAFRGHDESPGSRNRGNFIELIKMMAKFNVNVADTVLEKAPEYAKYASPDIQKEMLGILADRVRTKIRAEVGEAKFCILVDEARDESNKEQMAIVLRFVDSHGFVRERFFEIVRVPDTAALTLKENISQVLAFHNLDIQNIRGQGYDGASNMRGAWNGLQAKFLEENPYAYYIHCFAHRLQLALVAAANDETSVWLFFSKLTSIVNLVGASPKRLTELQSAQAVEIADMIANGERATGRGANQIGTLHRAGTTRWSSHFYSICSLIDMYDATCKVLAKMVEEGSSNSVRGEAAGALMALKSFDFAFILNLMSKIMGITDLLCRDLQHKSLDILNAMNMVSLAKELLKTLRADGWDSLFMQVEVFCNKNDIDMPDMCAPYKVATRRSSQLTNMHHYHFDIFNNVIDYQLSELNKRFPEETMELLTLSSALEPGDNYKSFKIDDICSLAEKFYHRDFSLQELRNLKSQLQFYELDIPNHPKFQNMSSISELCRGLVETNKCKNYYLIDRLIRLILTLPVSTATTERAFSAMKLVKSPLRNKMDNDFLRNSMILFIERELAEDIDPDSIIDEFASIKDRRVQLMDRRVQ